MTQIDSSHLDTMVSVGKARPEASRRPYSCPRLAALGDLRGMTFGGSPGLFDSGSENTQQPPV